MKLRLLVVPSIVTGILFSGSLVAAAQIDMMSPPAASAPQTAKPDPDMNDMSAAAPQSEAEKAAARAFAAHESTVKPPVAKIAAKNVVLTPLDARDRVIQLLNRFSFGPKPGQVDAVLASGADKWLAQQLDPASIDTKALDRRLLDFPTVSMTPPQTNVTFFDNGYTQAVADARLPYPADPMLAAVYQVQVQKLRSFQDLKAANGKVKDQETDAQIEQHKKEGKAEAERVAGELFALPPNQRMAALESMPVPDRIAFTSFVGGEQKTQLLADMTPREREGFNAMSANLNAQGFAAQELAQARVVRDIITSRQLQEVMTDFWFNHFNIYIGKNQDYQYAASYERDVIRKNALGSFKDLLMGTAESAAMMVYLDNWLSIGPDSLSNGVNPNNPDSKRGAQGLNENYGREVMELHTVGVNGGYSQADVTSLAAILTGWGVQNAGQRGDFIFDPNRHEPGPKRWFGYIIDDDGKVHKLPTDASAKLCPVAAIVAENPADAAVSCASAPTFGEAKKVATADSMRQGISALNILAGAPQTAHFISYLLAQKFVADEPPAALVDRLTKVFMESKGDIKTVLRAIITSPEFNSKQYFRNKVKTPIEFVASAFRATATDPQNPQALVGTIGQMGMPLYYALPPTGYYLTADQWMNSNALIARLNFSYALTNGKFANQPFDAPKLLTLGLLTPLPSAASTPAATAPAKPTVKPAATTRSNGDARLMSVAAVSGSSSADTRSPVTGATGEDIALRTLEFTMLGGPASAQTNRLIYAQLHKQPANASPTDTLNLLTALVMGSPEFQDR